MLILLWRPNPAWFIKCYQTHTWHTHILTLAIVKLAKNGPMPRQKLFHCSFPFTKVDSWPVQLYPIFHLLKRFIDICSHLPKLLLNLITYTVFAKHQINFPLPESFNLSHFWSKPTKDQVPDPGKAFKSMHLDHWKFKFISTTYQLYKFRQD